MKRPATGLGGEFDSLAAPLVWCAAIAQADTTTEAPGAARFWGRVNWPTVFVLGVIGALGWLAVELGDVREEVARNTESIRHIERRLDSMDSRLNAIEVSLAEMQASLAVLVARSGGSPTARKSTAQRQ